MTDRHARPRDSGIDLLLMLRKSGQHIAQKLANFGGRFQERNDCSPATIGAWDGKQWTLLEVDRAAAALYPEFDPKEALYFGDIRRMK